VRFETGVVVPEESKPRTAANILSPTFDGSLLQDVPCETFKSAHAAKIFTPRNGWKCRSWESWGDGLPVGSDGS